MTDYFFIQTSPGKVIAHKGSGQLIVASQNQFDKTQLWKAVKDGSLVYFQSLSDPNLVFDASSAAKKEGTPVLVYERKTSGEVLNQRWHFSGANGPILSALDNNYSVHVDESTLLVTLTYKTPAQTFTIKQQDPLYQALLAYWQFQGNLHDSTWNQHHGTIAAGAATYGTDSGHSFVGLDGTTYANVPVLPIFSSSFTITAWVNIENPNIYNCILCAWDVGGPYSFVTSIGTHGLRFVTRKPAPNNGANFFGMNTETNVAANEWHHYAAVWDKENATMSIYLDGSVVGSQKVADPSLEIASAGIKNFQIGFQLDGAPAQFCYKGKLSDLAVFGKALSQEEIVTFLAGGLTSSPFMVLPTVIIEL